jgi:ribosomal protein S18 acetylase RimI-like enzyme
MIGVRRAERSDLDVLARLFEQYRAFQGQPADARGARAFLAARLDRAESVVFIAHRGAEPVGFAQIYPSFSSVSLAPVLILNDLFVHEAGRRQGVASSLLAAVERHAVSVGAVRVTLNVARDNEAGQALYERRGWQRDAQFFMYHRFLPREGG